MKTTHIAAIPSRRVLTTTTRATLTLSVTGRIAVVESAVFVLKWHRKFGGNYDCRVVQKASAVERRAALVLDPNQPSCAVGRAARKNSTRGAKSRSKRGC